MKAKLAILALILLSLWGREASADSIMSGKLVFNTDPTSNTSPSHGSFVYDNTTNQFENITLTWDKMTFGLLGVFEGTQQGIYNALLNSTLGFVFDCTWLGDTAVPTCDDQLFGNFFDSNGDLLGLVGNGLPKLTPDTAGGTVTARNLKDPVTTPEPTAPGLLLLGIGFAFALRKRTTQVSRSTA
jgi:hypothetical protein